MENASPTITETKGQKHLIVNLTAPGQLVQSLSSRKGFLNPLREERRLSGDHCPASLAASQACGVTQLAVPEAGMLNISRGIVLTLLG